jgi:hypothetical protein
MLLSKTCTFLVTRPLPTDLGWGDVRISFVSSRQKRLLLILVCVIVYVEAYRWYILCVLRDKLFPYTDMRGSVMHMYIIKYECVVRFFLTTNVCNYDTIYLSLFNVLYSSLGHTLWNWADDFSSRFMHAEKCANYKSIILLLKSRLDNYQMTICTFGNNRIDIELSKSMSV